MKAISLLVGLALLLTAAASNLCSAEPTNAPSVITEPVEKIDINSASIPVLEAIPEIGTDFANAVFGARPYESVFELQPILKISDEGMVALHAKLTAVPPKIPSPLAIKPSARSSKSTVTNATPAPEVSTSPALASDKERAEAKRRHIRRVSQMMVEPPPHAREERIPASPGPNYVYKPGHWAPIKGEWKWTPGEWSVPPTPISVWIDGTYDVKSQSWSPGYWEPDKIQSPEGDGKQ